MVLMKKDVEPTNKQGHLGQLISPVWVHYWENWILLSVSLCPLLRFSVCLLEATTEFCDMTRSIGNETVPTLPTQAAFGVGTEHLHSCLSRPFVNILVESRHFQHSTDICGELVLCQALHQTPSFSLPYVDKEICSLQLFNAGHSSLWWALE